MQCLQIVLFQLIQLKDFTATHGTDGLQQPLRIATKLGVHLWAVLAVLHS